MDLKSSHDEGVKVQSSKLREPRGSDVVEVASPVMRSVEAVTRELAQSEVPVLLLAEPGVF